MPPTDDSELAGYILCEMMNGQQVEALCRASGLRVPPGNRKESSRQLGSLVRLDVVTEFCRERWERPSTDIHLRNLRSGLLAGHSWHGLAPSRLHLGLQDRVRRVARGELPLADFLSIGMDIARKEYVMVAIADLTEVALVERCGAVPPLKSRSLSDVVLRGVPFDVKNGSVPSCWTADRIRDDPASFARAMYEGADSDRDRKQANGAFNGWVNNRMFVVVADESRWLAEPESVLDDLAKSVDGFGNPIEVRTQATSFLSQVVVV